MSAPASAPVSTVLQRTSGVLRLEFERDGSGTTRLKTLYQEGAARARLPRVGSGMPLEAVLINTAGGLTGGDRMTTDVTLGSGTAATLTTQASEKIYRALEGETLILNRVEVGSNAALEWLPQETIFFDRARLERSLEVDVAPEGTALLAESVVFGRTAMGETVHHGLLRDRWRVRRGGRLVFADGISVTDPFGTRLARPVALDGGCAYATLLLVAPDAADRLSHVREALGENLSQDPPPMRDRQRTGRTPSCRAGASAWDGLLAVRIAARDGAALRPAVIRALTALRQGRPLPTVWHC